TRTRAGQAPDGIPAAQPATKYRPPDTTHRIPPTLCTSLTKESVMGIIAWIVLGLVAGLLANMLIPGKRSQGLILTCVIGIAGALGGGWAATELFHVHTLHGFFNLSTWLTAIAGSAVLLLVSHLLTGRNSRSRRFAHR
ncbi:MAG TPA: GlsB/YeaQ/YmgE family stress response membrane protein, partial [Streptosporangiaceae bacterium]|nr:GlsB/YeaQ/YmgE family stress response membrane protein [Streptosporangiaceae bacterium]